MKCFIFYYRQKIFGEWRDLKEVIISHSQGEAEVLFRQHRPRGDWYEIEEAAFVVSLISKDE